MANPPGRPGGDVSRVERGMPMGWTSFPWRDQCAGVAAISAAVEAVSSLGDADAPLASGAPFLAVAEPALLLLAFAVGAFGGAIGNADALDALGFRVHLILAGVEGRVCRHKVGGASEPCLLRFDRRDQQVRVVRPPIVDFIVDHNLVFRLLQLDHLSELVGLGGLALADDFRRWLEQAEYFSFGAGIAAKDARPRLLHHLLHPRHHLIELLFQAFECQLCHDIARSLDALGNLLGKPFRLSDYPAGGREQFAVGPLKLLLALRALGARRPPN